MEMALMARTVLGALVAQLIAGGYRVEVSDQDGGGLYVYAAPYNGERPDDGWECWVRFGDDPEYPIWDYSTNLEHVLRPVFVLQAALTGDMNTAAQYFQPAKRGEV